MRLKVKKINPDDPRPKLPTRGSKKAAGLDLYSLEERTLRVGQIHAFETGISVEIPTGHEGQVRPRSGLALRDGITVLNAPGTIDEDYTGPIKVILVNHGSKPVLIQEGHRIGQLVIKPVVKVTPEWAVEIKETERGDAGFGSTGV